MLLTSQIRKYSEPLPWKRKEIRLPEPAVDGLVAYTCAGGAGGGGPFFSVTLFLSADSSDFTS